MTHPKDVPAKAATGDVNLIAASDGLMARPFEAAVCVPTYRRPDMLRRTLASLQAQRTSRRFAIVVVDNDGERREGSALAASVLAEGGFEGAVLLEPRQGNCKAYNAAWRFVRRSLPDIRYLCGLDDDEEATQGWLAALIDGAEAGGAAIVGGPVHPVFSEPRFEYLRQHPVFRSHYAEDGPVPQLYSSANYLIRAETLDRMGQPYLDEAFDYKGGGDTDFFTRARAAGMQFHWTMAALVEEAIPARRTEASWIRARALRNGMISALIAHKADPSAIGRARTFAKSLALLAASPLRGLGDAIRTGSPLIGMYHAEVAIGRLGAEFGLNIEQYRAPEKN